MGSGDESPASVQEAEPPDLASVTDWIAVLAGSLGALLASLDTSITNSALPQIQGEIGASGTEGTWISTGYLVSEVVIIPLCAWLMRVLGMRTLLLICAISFTLFSVLCGTSHNLTTMIIGRVGQGFTGGGLIPTAQVIVRTRLPMRQVPLGMTIFGMIVLTGPLIGPVLGGWLTENASWQWCFLINVPVSFALIALLLLGMPHVRANLGLFIRADWLGIVGLTACLSCLTVILEEGQRDRWFESSTIRWLTAVAIVGLIGLVIAQLTSRDPVIKLGLLRNPSYAGVIIIVLSVGTVMYSLLYVLPQFLSAISGYNAEQSGRVLFISGIPAFVMMPILPRLLGRANIRLMVICGLICFAISCFMDVHLTGDSSGGDFVWSQLLRGLGQVMSFMPLNQASMGAVSREQAADAAGLYSMSRNLGGSFGLAALGIFIDRRTELHADSIRETVNANAPLVQDRIAAMAAAWMPRGGDPATAHMQALRQLAGQIHRQAMVITYADCFALLGIVLIASLPLTLVLRQPPPMGREALDAH